MGRTEGNLLHPLTPLQENDQATIESKNNHLVRKYAFYYRYDVDEERAVLNRTHTLRIAP